VRASDPKLFNTHDAKGRRKLFATPKTVSPDFAQWPERLLRKWRCRLFEQNARQFIPDRFLNMGRRPHDFRKCSKPIKLRLTLFLQPNHGFGESFCGSAPGRPQYFF
jgi:hypothetical protein